MRIATFNVENLFERPSIMNLDDWKKGKNVLTDYTRLNDLISNDTYSEAEKDEMLTIMARYGGLISNQESTYIRLRAVRGQFVKNSIPPVIIANGRADWIGWFELTTEAVKETATENTARVIRELHADIMCVIEAEDRIALKHFNETAMPKVGDRPFEHVMLIDGNDARGIDVGILVRGPYTIRQIASHVDDKDSDGLIFSRDCAEYLVIGKSGEQVLVLVNHFKSKGYGPKDRSNTKRKRQAERVRQIYQQRLREGFHYIAIVGDLNDTPDSDALSSLLVDGLIDIMQHPKFKGDSRAGTYGNGSKSDKIDYILMSPELAAKGVTGSVERRGVWGGKNGTLFPHFPEIKRPEDAASDHAALWVDLAV
jgi:endonuclease/exonuclease/phosphatase family metal-dependent hydrolase